MKALTYIERGRFEVTEKLKPVVVETTDAVVKVTMSSICTSDLHIKHGSVPRAVPGITVGHEMVGVGECRRGCLQSKAGRSCGCECGDVLR